VIGAGIVGVNCAIALQSRGLQVELIDPNPPGSQTSSGNAGCFAVSEILPVSLPGLIWRLPRMLMDPLGPLSIRWQEVPRLAPWLWEFWRAGRIDRVEAAVRVLAGLLQRTWVDYTPVLTAARLTHLVRQRGTLALFRSETAFRETQGEWNIRLRNGVRAELLDADGIRDLEPDLAPIFARGYFLTGWGHTIDPQKLTSGLAHYFESGGGKITQARVAAFTPKNGAPSIAICADGSKISFENVVICAGAWSKPLCHQLGYDVPLDTERGYNTTLPTPNVQLSRPICDVEYNYVVTPLAGGLRVGGAVELAGLKASPNFARSKALLELCRQALPGLNDEGGTQWMGFRPSMPDSLPVIARSRFHKNVFFGFGHGHLGLTEAATTGRLIAELVSGQPTCLDLVPFSIDRFRRGYSGAEGLRGNNHA
jgi:D-amino-acid dehydrogenase